MLQDVKTIKLSVMLDIDFPIIVAPMFLVSNKAMVVQAIRSGVTGAIPALNYRTVKELHCVIFNRCRNRRRKRTFWVRANATSGPRRRADERQI